MATEFGFYFYPADGDNSHGHPKLAFNVYGPEPTGVHFDPERALVPTVGRHHEIEETSIHHPWHGRNELQVCVGRITLLDRRHKEVEAFSFGGTLTLTAEDDRTACLLTSPAPIFDLVNPLDALTNVISGIEAAIAMQRAHWPHDYVFAEHLTAVDPKTLYAGGLLSQQAELKAIPETAHTPDIRAQHHMINEMIAAAKRANLLDAHSRPLDQLLAAP